MGSIVDKDRENEIATILADIISEYTRAEDVICKIAEREDMSDVEKVMCGCTYGILGNKLGFLK